MPGEGEIPDDDISDGTNAVLPDILAMMEVVKVELVNDRIGDVAPRVDVDGTGTGKTDMLETIVGGTIGAPEADGLVDDSEEMTGVITGVRVTSVLKRLGGATLFSHPVVPLTTEK